MSLNVYILSVPDIKRCLNLKWLFLCVVRTKKCLCCDVGFGDHFCFLCAHPLLSTFYLHFLVLFCVVEFSFLLYLTILLFIWWMCVIEVSVVYFYYIVEVKIMIDFRDFGDVWISSFKLLIVYCKYENGENMKSNAQNMFCCQSY